MNPGDNRFSPREPCCVGPNRLYNIEVTHHRRYDYTTTLVVQQVYRGMNIYYYFVSRRVSEDEKLSIIL